MPEEWQESEILAETHWTWQELQDTPADVVNRLMLFLQVKSTMDSGGEMAFNG